MAQSIENHAIVGNLRTAALIGLDGAVNFLCWPRFDSPSIFASLLDDERGGSFELTPMLDGPRHRQLYLPDTNVLLTRFLSSDGVAEISDFMTIGDLDAGSYGQNRISADPGYVSAAFKETSDYWRRWVRRSTYRGRWREIVNRSALVLKLLTSSEHGSIIAALTFGLPEEIGGIRNWDYRYTWLRDAAFTVYAFLRLGHVEEANAFVRWLGERESRCGADGTLHLMYTLDGRGVLTEAELPHLRGYRGSAPVRIGNAALKQLQLDIYGELMDALSLSDKYGEQEVRQLRFRKDRAP